LVEPGRAGELHAPNVLLIADCTFESTQLLPRNLIDRPPLHVPRCGVEDLHPTGALFSMRQVLGVLHRLPRPCSPDARGSGAGVIASYIALERGARRGSRGMGFSALILTDAAGTRSSSMIRSSCTALTIAELPRKLRHFVGPAPSPGRANGYGRARIADRCAGPERLRSAVPTLVSRKLADRTDAQALHVRPRCPQRVAITCYDPGGRCTRPKTVRLRSLEEIGADRADTSLQDSSPRSELQAQIDSHGDLIFSKMLENGTSRSPSRLPYVARAWWPR